MHIHCTPSVTLLNMTDMRAAIADIKVMLDHQAEMTHEDWTDVAAVLRSLSEDAEDAAYATNSYLAHKDDFIGPFLPPESSDLLAVSSTMPRNGSERAATGRSYAGG